MDETKRYFFVQDFDPAFDYTKGHAVSLAPQVSYRLGLRGIPYQTLEDFYDERELRKNEVLFFKEEIARFDAFDVFIKRKVRYCRRYDIRLMRTCFHQLKYFIDSVIIQARVLSKVLGGIGSNGELIYLRRRNPKRIAIENFSSDETAALYPEFFRILTKQNKSLRYSLHEFGDRAAPPDRSIEGETPLGSFKKQFLMERVKPLYFFLKYGGPFPCRSRGESRGLRALFLHSGSSHLDIPIKQLRARGWELFVRVEKEIYSLNSPGLRWRIEKGGTEEEESEIQEDCLSLARALMEEAEGRDFLNWVIQQSRSEILEVILPPLQDYFKSTCLKILSEALAYEHFYKEAGIDYVVSHTNSDSASKSALIAARARQIKTVGIQHGCQVFDDKGWLITDIDFFDYYFAADGFSERKFQKGLAQDYVKPCRIFQSPHYLTDIQTYVRRRNPGNRNGRRILYVSAKLRVHARQFNMSAYPATWYFEYQKALMDLFNTRFPGLDFVYKHVLMNRKYADESIIAYLKQRRFKNITVESGPMRECLARVDAVIIDRPTTAFFEAVAGGLPVLALYPDFVETLIHSDAKECFGKSLQAFSTREEAFDKVSAFLNGNPSEYKNVIALNQDDLGEVLSQEAESFLSMGAPAGN